MSTFLFSFDATTTITGGTPPTLEILVGGVVMSSVEMQAGATSYDVFVDFTGLAPSSVTLRFAGSSGSPGDSISITAASINNTALNVATDLTATLLSQAQTSGVTAANSIYGYTTPTLDTPTITGDANDNNLRGNTAADVIDGAGGADRLYGMDNDDQINGGAGDDVLFGQNGADTILGGTGNDVLFGNADNDILYGEADNDFLIGGDGDDILNGGIGNDGLLGDAGNDVMFGEAGDDLLVGDAGDDILIGDEGNDQLIGGIGNDQLAGGDNDDWLSGEAGNDLLNGGAGNDEIHGGAGADVAVGGAGTDDIYGGDGDDILAGDDDNDYVSGGDGADTLYGDNGSDVVIGGNGADTIYGGANDDILHGHGLDAATISDILFNNANVVYSQETGSFYQFVNTNVNYATAATNAAATTLNGVAGHLATVTSAAENTFISNIVTDNAFISGADIAQDGTWQWNAGLEAGMQFSDISGTSVNGMYENWDTGQPQTNTEYNAVFYTNGTWHDWVDTSTHSYVIEWEAGLFNDDAAADILSGGSGNDWIFGYDGDDTIDGESDNDFIFGGAGSDILSGSAGNDIIYAYDATVETASAITAGNTVTILDEDFTGSAGTVFTYSDGGFGGSDPANVDVTGSHDNDGNIASGSLEVFIDGQNNSAFTNASGSWDASVSHTANLTNVQITFSYRHWHRAQNDTGEDSQVWFEFDGTTYDASGGNSFISEALGSAGTTDTGWITVTIDLPDLTASTTYNLSLGILHTGANRSNEDSYVRFDDITITGDEPAVGGPPTTNNADIGEMNTVNGGSGTDTIYGSAGTDTLNGDAGADTIYSASANEAWDAAVAAVLAANTGVVYSAETNSFYQHVTTNATWTTANTNANAATLTGLTGNGYLAAVTSQAENDYIFSFAGGNRLWIGGSDAATEGEWSWTNTSTGPESGLQFHTGGSGGGALNSHYTNWVAGDPSNGSSAWDYTEYRADGTWWSNASTASFDYIIEWDADTLMATVDRTTLNGGSGADTLYGNDGIDTFVFETATWDATDTIENFSATGRDAIDISDLLTGFNYTTSDINDFVTLTEASGNTTIAVDANGTTGGASFTDVAVLNGVTGLDLYQMIGADNLIV